MSVLCGTVRSHNVDIREVQACKGPAPIFRPIVCERFPLKAVIRFGPQCHRQRGARLPEMARRTSAAFSRAYLILNATAERAFSSESETRRDIADVDEERCVSRDGSIRMAQLGWLSSSEGKMGDR